MLISKVVFQHVKVRGLFWTTGEGMVNDEGIVKLLLRFVVFFGVFGCLLSRKSERKMGSLYKVLALW